jgi:AcrR family transcriptional regulator
MQERSQKTRSQIQRAALKLFAKNGYDATGVAEVCKAAGVSKGSFYHHYDAKQDVFLDLLETWVAGLEAELGEMMAASKNVPEAILTIAGHTKKIFRDSDGTFHIFLEFWSRASRDPVVWKKTIAPYERFLALFEQVIQKGVDEGSLKPVDARFVSRVLVSLALGVVAQGVFMPKGGAWDVLARDAVDFFLRGILKER